MKKGLYTTVFPQGEPKEEYPRREHEPNSLVNAAMAIHMTSTGGTSSEEFADINGTLYQILGDSDPQNPRIEIGDGSTAVAYDDNYLYSQLNSEPATQAYGIDDNDSLVRTTYSSTIPNNSGNPWGVSEAGITVVSDEAGGGSARFMTARDTFGSQTVSDGEQIAVEFEFTAP